jgi:preprotein translocase subunit SecE
MFGVWALFAAGAWKFTQIAFDSVPLLNELGVRYIVAGLIVAFGLWFGYRLVHWTTFADFLISVESEMVKVSWPGKAELRSSTIVVLVVFVLLSAMIYLFDFVWVFIFNQLQILR